MPSPSRMGISLNTRGLAEIDCRASSDAFTWRPGTSILLMKITCGMALAWRNLSSRDTVSAFSASGSQTTTATSTTIRALNASCASSMEPGQSMKVQDSSRYSALAMEISELICRARASGALSPTVFPSLDVPLRLTAPAADSMASIRLVLPLR